MTSSTLSMSPGQIKAIETVYNGYRFRSRLEARWAVFFDALGIKYLYESEGFDLGDGVWYLPDFWLPHYLWFIEVKGNRENISDDEWNKIRLLDDNAIHLPNYQGWGVIIVEGDPNNRDMTIPPFDEIHDENWHFHVRIASGFSRDEIKTAVQKARSARFEHGESG